MQIAIRPDTQLSTVARSRSDEITARREHDHLQVAVSVKRREELGLRNACALLLRLTLMRVRLGRNMRSRSAMMQRALLMLVDLLARRMRLQPSLPMGTLKVLLCMLDCHMRLRPHL